jgi:hypothetical protein
MTSVIKISLLKDRDKNSDKDVITNEPNMNPVVVLQRLNDSELKSLMKKIRKTNEPKIIKQESFELLKCPLCDVINGFPDEDFLTKHFVKFHKISTKNLKKKNSACVTTVLKLLKIPVTSFESGKGHQCFVCSLAFDLKDTLSLHLDKVHGIVIEEPNHSLELDQTSFINGKRDRPNMTSQT